MFWSVMGGVIVGELVAFLVKCVVGAVVRERRARANKEMPTQEELEALADLMEKKRAGARR